MPKKCPKCKSENLAPIKYGLPGPEMMREAQEGKIILGGCVVSDKSPKWACRECCKTGS